MTDTSYVRTEMVEARMPPRLQTGLVRIFNDLKKGGIWNLTLSAASILFSALVLFGLIRWIWSPTWTATSLAECREIIGSSHGKACWGVIRERWLQILFGFYPPELYWRPILAFLLAGLALVPVLSERAPRIMVRLAPLFLLAAPYLLWGGSLWDLMSILASIVLFVLVMVFVIGRAGAALALGAGVAAAAIWWFVVGPIVVSGLNDVLPVGLTPVASRAFGGFLLSITIGLVAILCSLPIGVVLALGRTSHLPVVRILCVGFIEFIRGVPLITLLFVASTLLNIFLPPGTSFDIILRVMIMVTLFASAYMAEVIRGGLAALPKGQTEGADSLGFTYWQRQRLIIMPQALKISIPGIVSIFIAVFKDTTLVSIIGLIDPLGLATTIRADTAWTGIVWEIYGIVALVFFVLCFSMSQYSQHLERKLHTGHK